MNDKTKTVAVPFGWHIWKGSCMPVESPGFDPGCVGCIGKGSPISTSGPKKKKKKHKQWPGLKNLYTINNNVKNKKFPPFYLVIVAAISVIVPFFLINMCKTSI